MNKKSENGVDLKTFTPEIISVGSLKAHPRNYRAHPDDQLNHIIESIREHGFYRNIVVANDGTILAGHGVVEAAKKSGMVEVPVIRLSISPDDPRALKVLTGDNEISRLSEVDDRMLTEILKQINDTSDQGLLGTGYDENMLAALAFVSRPASEVKDFNAAAEWVGMPEYESGSKPIQLVVTFRNQEDREEFVRISELSITGKNAATWSTWWPERETDDISAIRFNIGDDSEPNQE